MLLCLPLLLLQYYPYPYLGEVSGYPQVTWKGSLMIDSWLPGDFNLDGAVDAQDAGITCWCMHHYDGTGVCCLVDQDASHSYRGRTLDPLKDGDVDQSDFGVFQLQLGTSMPRGKRIQECISGATIPQMNSDCCQYDYDNDGDVDMDDFGEAQLR